MEGHRYMHVSNEGIDCLRLNRSFIWVSYTGIFLKTVLLQLNNQIKNIIHDFIYQCPILLQDAVDYINKDDIRQAYRKHNLYVQSIVPKENLLIWNLKDGWEPLYSFLGKKVPKGPIPHDNKTGDVEFIRNYAYRTNIYAVGIRNVAKNLLLFVLKVMLGLYLVYVFLKKSAE